MINKRRETSIVTHKNNKIGILSNFSFVTPNILPTIPPNSSAITVLKLDTAINNA